MTATIGGVVVVLPAPSPIIIIISLWLAARPKQILHNGVIIFTPPQILILVLQILPFSFLLINRDLFTRFVDLIYDLFECFFHFLNLTVLLTLQQTVLLLQLQVGGLQTSMLLLTNSYLFFQVLDFRS